MGEAVINEESKKYTHTPPPASTQLCTLDRRAQAKSKTDGNPNPRLVLGGRAAPFCIKSGLAAPCNPVPQCEAVGGAVDDWAIHKNISKVETVTNQKAC